MKENGRKVVSLVFLSVVSLLLLALTISAFTPIISISTDHVGMSESFSNGSFTGDHEVAEVEIGFFDMVNIVKNWKYIMYINNIQNTERSIQKAIEESQGGESNEETIAHLQEELQQDYLALGENDLEILEEKLQDREFIETFATFDIISNTLFNFSSGEHEETAIIDTNSHGLVYIVILKLFSIAAIIILAMIMPIALAISTIVLIVRLIKNAKNLANASLSKMVPRIPMGFFLMVGVFAYFFFNAMYRSLAFELGFILPCIFVAIIVTIFMANDIIFAEKKKVAFLRSGILVTSVIGVLLIAFSFNNSTHLFAHFDNVETVAQNCAAEAYEEEYERLMETESPENVNELEMIERQANSYAKNVARQAAKKELNIVAITTLISTFFVVIMICFVISICIDNGSTVKTNQTGGTKIAGGVASASPVLAGIVLVTLIIPLFLGSAGTVEERNNAFNSNGCGSMILWDEYTMEDSDYYVEEDDIEEFEKEYSEYLKEIDEAIDDTEDKDEKKMLELAKANAESEYVSTFNYLERVKCGQKSAAILALVGALICMIAQTFGKIVQKKGEDTFLDKKTIGNSVSNNA